MAHVETGTASFSSAISEMTGFTLTAGVDAAVVQIRPTIGLSSGGYIVKAALGTTTTLAFDEPVTCKLGSWYVELVSGTAPQMSIEGDSSTVFSPLELGPAAWYDFSDASTMFSDAGTTRAVGGGPIFQINDKSGTGKTLTRGGASGTEPTLIPAAQNGRSVARFDGGDWLRSDAFGAAGTSHVVIAAYQHPSGTTLMGAWSLTDNTNSRLQVNVNNGDNSIQTSVGTGVGTYNEIWAAPPVGAVVHSVAVANSGALSQVYGNGTLADSSSGTPAINTGTAFAIGSRQASAGAGLTNGLVGDFYELVVYNYQISGAQRLAVERYLGTKWGITVA